MELVKEYIQQSVIHSFIAAMMIEALMRTWKIKNPALILKFRLVILFIALFSFPIYQLFYPSRSSTAFRENLALFDLGPWLEIPVWDGFYVKQLLFFILILCAASFFFQEVLPIIKEKLADQHQLSLMKDDPQSNILFIDSDAADIHTRGIKNPRILVSKGLVQLLSSEELQGVIAHEEAHVLKGDLIKGWALFLVMAFYFFEIIGSLKFFLEFSNVPHCNKA